MNLKDFFLSTNLHRVIYLSHPGATDFSCWSAIKQQLSISLLIMSNFHYKNSLWSPIWREKKHDTVPISENIQIYGISFALSSLTKIIFVFKRQPFNCRTLSTGLYEYFLHKISSCDCHKLFLRAHVGYTKRSRGVSCVTMNEKEVNNL